MAKNAGWRNQPNITCEFGKNIIIGNDVYINFGCMILDCGLITIGNNTLIGPNVNIISGNHELNPEARSKGDLIPAPITIGDKVWIGANVAILPGSFSINKRYFECKIHNFIRQYQIKIAFFIR